MKTLRNIQSTAALLAMAFGLTIGVTSCKKDTPAPTPMVKKQLRTINDGQTETILAWSNDKVSTLIKGDITATYQWDNDRITELVTQRNGSSASTQSNTLRLSDGKVSEYITDGYTVKYAYRDGLLSKTETTSQGQQIEQYIFNWSADKLNVLSSNQIYAYTLNSSQSFKGIVPNPIVTADFMPLLAKLYPELFGLPQNKLVTSALSYPASNPDANRVAKQYAYQFDTDGYVTKVTTTTNGVSSVTSYKWQLQ